MDAATFVFTFSRSVVTAMTRTSTRKGSSVAHSAFLHGSQCRRRGGGSHRLIVHRSDSSKGSSNWCCYWWQRQKPIGSWVVSRHTQSWLSAKITADCHHHSSIQKPKHRAKFFFFKLKRKKIINTKKTFKNWWSNETSFLFSNPSHRLETVTIIVRNDHYSTSSLNYLLNLVKLKRLVQLNSIIYT